MRPQCSPLLLFLLATVTVNGARCPHDRSSFANRQERSVPAVAAMFAGAAAVVSAAANSQDWSTFSDDTSGTDSGDEVTQRLEYIKQEILRRLGLTDAPRVKRQMDPSTRK